MEKMTMTVLEMAQSLGNEWEQESLRLCREYLAKAHHPFVIG